MICFKKKDIRTIVIVFIILSSIVTGIVIFFHLNNTIQLAHENILKFMNKKSISDAVFILEEEHNGDIFKVFNYNDGKDIGMVYFEKDNMFKNRYKFGGMSLTSSDYGTYIFSQGKKFSNESLNVIYGINKVGGNLYLEFYQGTKKVVDLIGSSEYFIKIYRQIHKGGETTGIDIINFYDKNMKTVTDLYIEKPPLTP